MSLKRLKRRQFLRFVPVLSSLPAYCEVQKFNAGSYFIENLDIVLSRPVCIKQMGRGSSSMRLNSSAEFILGLCDGKRTTYEIAKELAQAFEVNFARSLDDCVDTVITLNEMGFISLLI